MTKKKKLLIAIPLALLIAIPLAIVAAVAALCVAIAMQPDRFSISRSAVLAAPPERVFPLVNDLAAWDSWSPWKELDPNAKMTFSTPSAGKGATCAWSGNDQVGEGTLTVLESKPNELVEVEQAFVRPMAGKARMEFALAPEGSGTKVTWTMDGENDFLGKAMCLFMDMEAMLGPQFDKALAAIKAHAEKEPQPAEPVTP